MVHVTTAAVRFLERKRGERQIPQSHGVRIYGRTGSGSHPPQLAMTFASDPEEDDVELKQAGARFFIAPEIHQSVQGLVIDISARQDHKLRLRRHRTAP